MKRRCVPLFSAIREKKNLREVFKCPPPPTQRGLITGISAKDILGRQGTNYPFTLISVRVHSPLLPVKPFKLMSGILLCRDMLLRFPTRSRLFGVRGMSPVS